MNCCDDYGQCKQGPGCPVRETKMAHTTESLIERLRTTPPNVLKEREAAHLITELAADRDALEKMVRQYVQNFNEVEDERNTLRAQLDALQSVDELPESGAYRVTDGEGDYTYRTGEPEFFNVDWAARYGHNYELLYTPDQLRQAQAMAREKLLVELGEVEAVGEVIQPGVIRWAHKYPPTGTKLYTRPLPAQDVNAELVEELENLMQWHSKTSELWPTGMEQSTFHNRAALTISAALANAKAAQQKEGA